MGHLPTPGWGISLVKCWWVKPHLLRSTPHDQVLITEAWRVKSKCFWTPLGFGFKHLVLLGWNMGEIGHILCPEDIERPHFKDFNLPMNRSWIRLSQFGIHLLLRKEMGSYAFCWVHPCSWTFTPKPKARSMLRGLFWCVLNRGNLDRLMVF